MKRKGKALKSNSPAFYIIQELKIDFIKNLEDKLCGPEAMTLNIETQILKKLHVQLLFLLY